MKYLVYFPRTGMFLSSVGREFGVILMTLDTHSAFISDIDTIEKYIRDPYLITDARAVDENEAEILRTFNS